MLHSLPERHRLSGTRRDSPHKIPRHARYLEELQQVIRTPWGEPKWQVWVGGEPHSLRLGAAPKQNNASQRGQSLRAVLDPNLSA